MNNKLHKTTPALRFSEFENLGEWEAVYLGVGEKSISTFVKQKILINTLTLENYISTENILPDYAGVKDASKLPRMGAFTQFKIGDILVSNIRPYLKKVWSANKNGGASNDVLVIRAKSKVIASFLTHLLKNDAFINHVMIGAKGVKMPRGDVYSIKKYPLYYPKLKEQQKIADCLSSLDNLISTQSKKLTALQQHKKGLMQNLFPADGETCPKLRFPEFQNTRKWKIKKLGDIATLKKGRGLSKSKLSKDGKYKCILYGELFTTYNETINKIKSRTDFNEGVHSIVGDVLIPASTTTTAIDLANTTLVNENSILLGGDINIVRPIDKCDVDSMFLTYILAYNKKRSIAKLAQGVTIIHLYGSSLEKLIIPIPKPKEQQKIADCLSSLDNLISIQTKKLTALQLHKKGLMQNLFPNNEALE